jgi:hypothetical protein
MRIAIAALVLAGAFSFNARADQVLNWTVVPPTIYTSGKPIPAGEIASHTVTCEMVGAPKVEVTVIMPALGGKITLANGKYSCVASALTKSDLHGLFSPALTVTVPLIAPIASAAVQSVVNTSPILSPLPPVLSLAR